ncbi:hypothetical protein Taro_042807 [Colocasia esculenta]|uniref:Uncharacterized protein n=1 Tax=Colocasia esculenta TaxID=4460 RepID=A0A843WZC0_COLES|nr:hypothetical protein [Colocasia esculenta]
MVHGARSGSSSGRSSRGRGLFVASASSPSSAPPPIAVATGPSSVSPPVAVGSGQSTPSPHTVVGPVPEDAVSLQEGGGSFYDSTLREVQEFVSVTPRRGISELDYSY